MKSKIPIKGDESMADSSTAQGLRPGDATVVAMPGRPTRQQIVKRAAEIAPHLIVRQAEAEQRTFYGEDTHEAFREAGFYRILVPGRFGGLGYDIGTFCRVVMEISSGCPSAGWQFNLGASHASFICALFAEDVQAELFAGGDFICAATIAPQGTACKLDSGDWSISGVFNYASGIPYSRYFLSHALPVNADGSRGPVLTFIAPRDQWRRLDDWGKSLGLKASGSHSVEMVDAIIPARFVLEGTDMVNSGQGGAPRAEPGDTSVERHGRLLSVNVIGATAMVVGMLKGAVREYVRLMEVKKTMRPPITFRHQDADYRRWLGIAAGKLSVAEATIINLCDQWTHAAQRAAAGGSPFSAQEDARMCAAALEIMNLCWDAMQGTLWPTAGTSAAMDGEIMQRIFRDMAMARSHVVNISADPMRRDLGQYSFSETGANFDGLWSASGTV
jgi:3-hydroxy-9,10-secoandrosta-1,3,5(10)-triene-9,17-dione monooxygenase